MSEFDVLPMNWKIILITYLAWKKIIVLYLKARTEC